MRTEQLTVEVFRFEELDREVQEKIIKNLRNDDGFCWHEVHNELLTESFQRQLEEKCYPCDDIEWSLSYSQGDGVAFYGDIDVCELAERLKNEGVLTEKEYARIEYLYNEYDFSITIRRNSFATHYSHAHTMSLDADTNLCTEDRVSGYDLLSEVAKKMLNHIQREIEELSHKFEEEGYGAIEYQTSEEYIIEEIQSRDMEFTVDGREWLGI